MKHAELEITILSEQFEKDGVIVTLEWTEENSLYSYNISVSPQLEVMFIERVSFRVQLSVPYNSFYNVSIAAVPLCRRNNVTTFIGPSLYYSEYQQLLLHALVVGA